MLAKARAASFKRLIFRAAVLPVVLLLALAGVLVWQVNQLLRTTSQVEHSDLILANANELQRLMIDMETGLRGYLITDDTEFLAPYERGVANVPDQTEELTALASDSPSQSRRLAGIASTWKQWRRYAESELELRHNDDDWMSGVSLGTGKELMDDIRDTFTEMISEEEGLRAQRVLASKGAARQSSWIACGAALGVGAILVLRSRRELRALASTYETSLRTTEQLASDLEKRVAERTEALGRTNVALSEANKELEAFAYSISHDLRAPLRHIGGFGDLLKRSMDGRLTPDDVENLDTIIETAKQAGRMVDDLLAFSRIGRAELRKEPVALGELVERCRYELSPETTGRNIEWKIDSLPTVTGDPALLRLVITNLLSNAVKYTEKVDRATIEISASSQNGDATIVVRDNGVGFDMSYSHKLFGVFQRLHHAEEYEGTGIGLANVRRIILRHGGRVWAEGRLGEGAAFYFTLPLKEPPDARSIDT